MTEPEPMRIPIPHRSRQCGRTALVFVGTRPPRRDYMLSYSGRDLLATGEYRWPNGEPVHGSDKLVCPECLKPLRVTFDAEQNLVALSRMSDIEDMLTVIFIYFRTLTLDHLDAAWFSLSQQDLTSVEEIIVLDNNTDDAPDAIRDRLDHYPVSVPVRVVSEKHGDPRRTHCWSSNRAFELSTTDNLFVTRADFLLNPDCLARFRAAQVREAAMFTTSWCHQMGCDASLSNTDVLADHSKPDAGWRTDPRGAASLVGAVPANHFHATDVDAGVYLTYQSVWVVVGRFNESMVGWGVNQQDWQRRIARHRLHLTVIPDYLFHHQHHYAPRG